MSSAAPPMHFRRPAQPGSVLTLNRPMRVVLCAIAASWRVAGREPTDEECAAAGMRITKRALFFLRRDGYLHPKRLVPTTKAWLELERLSPRWPDAKPEHYFGQCEAPAGLEGGKELGGHVVGPRCPSVALPALDGRILCFAHRARVEDGLAPLRTEFRPVAAKPRLFTEVRP